ncbi:hypothetical protein Zm00014a_039388 [Zea mays]|uniref:Uncharacterized protein n=1 Tax=Zea mays TaxID=4577 RepID=A0A3L6EKK4_MAIZE|nr:hypothetical protein Zm00014a_039388 [Zea mays]
MLLYPKYREEFFLYSLQWCHLKPTLNIEHSIPSI